jgi:glycosyltransferase involved in cell wall biosynthesis
MAGCARTLALLPGPDPHPRPGVDGLACRHWAGAVARRVQLGTGDMSTEGRTRSGVARVGAPVNGDGASGDRRNSLSVFFPVYNDEATVRRVTEKALRVCGEIADTYEVVIVDDGSPDASGRIADALASEYDAVSVVHHPRNLGYGAAVRSGLAASRYEWVCFTDGDDEYDLRDLRKLWRLRQHYDLIITFRYVRRYSGFRILVSRVYNVVLRHLFFTRYRDVSTGLRLVRKCLVDELTLEATSPFIGAEIAIKSMLKGYRVGELGIQTYPREFGRGSSTSPQNIYRTIVDMVRCYRRVFSTDYELPAGEPAREAASVATRR